MAEETEEEGINEAERDEIKEEVHDVEDVQQDELDEDEDVENEDG
jgi:hypothetical protein